MANNLNAAQTWVAGGGSPILAGVMAQIANFEGSSVPYSYIIDSNGLPSVGLWQINGGNFQSLANAGIVPQMDATASGFLNQWQGAITALEDPTTNAKAAAYILGSQGFGAWSSWNSEMPSVLGSSLWNSLNNIGSDIQKGTANLPADIVSELQGIGGAGNGSSGSSGTNPWGIVGEAIGAVGTGHIFVPTVQDAQTAQSVADSGWFGFIQTEANTLALSLFFGSLAIALIAGGIAWLAMSNNTVRSDVETAGKAAALA